MLRYNHSVAIILVGRRGLVALLGLYLWWLGGSPDVPRGCLPFVIVVFPDHTHSLLPNDKI